MLIDALLLFLIEMAVISFSEDIVLCVICGNRVWYNGSRYVVGSAVVSFIIELKAPSTGLVVSLWLNRFC